MQPEAEWRERVKGILKAEMKRRNVTYDGLAAKLAEIGVKEDARNLRNKVSRGTFTAAFFVQCLAALGCDVVRL